MASTLIYAFQGLHNDDNILGFHQGGVGILEVRQISLTNGGHLLGVLEYGLVAVIAQRLQQEKNDNIANDVNVKALHLLYQVHVRRLGRWSK